MSTFSTVDQLTRTLLSELSGRDIRFASLQLTLSGYTADARIFLDGNPLPSDQRSFDRVPTGEHTLRVEQARPTGQYSAERTVTLTGGEREQVAVYLPLLSDGGRERFLRRVWEETLAATSHRKIRHNITSVDIYEFIESLPGEDASTRLKRWARSMDHRRTQWHNNRRTYYPDTRAAIDGKPSEWRHVVPQAGHWDETFRGLTGKGSRLESVRIGWRPPQIYFLMTSTDTFNIRNDYRLYFDIRYGRFDTLILSMEPSAFGDGGSYTMTLEDEEEGTFRDINVDVPFRFRGPFLEGVIRLGSESLGEVFRLNHAKIERSSGEGIEVSYSTDSGSLRDKPRQFGTSTSEVLDAEALESWLERRRSSQDVSQQ